MSHTVRLREENPNDHSDIHHLLIESFRDSLFSDHEEHLLVERLRRSDSFVPELAIVAELENRPVGYVLLTKATINSGEESTPILLLAPLAVLPFFQEVGIGGQLLKSAQERAKGLGYSAIVLIGQPEYYSQHGYRPTHEFGIRFRTDLPKEYSMLLVLNEKAPPEGEVIWDKAFDE